MFQDHRRSEGRSSSTGNLSEAVVHRERDVKDSADTTFQGICATTTCFHWHPTESGCRFGDNCLFNHALAANQPSKKNEGMWWRRISCVAEDFHTIKQGSSRFGTAEIQVITEGLKTLGPKHSVIFSKGASRHMTIRERSPSSARSACCSTSDRKLW